MYMGRLRISLCCGLNIGREEPQGQGGVSGFSTSGSGRCDCTARRACGDSRVEGCDDAGGNGVRRAARVQERESSGRYEHKSYGRHGRESRGRYEAAWRVR
ncbi:hypothetical protein GCM10027161_05330 [Microbispora hainanensis]